MMTSRLRMLGALALAFTTTATVAAATPPASAPAASAAAADALVLTSRGLGPVRLGMSTAQVRAAWHGPLATLDGPPELDCGSLRSGDDTSLPVDFFLEHGKLRSIGVRGPGISTRSGIAVGTPFARVQALFGRELDVSKEVRDGYSEATLWETGRGYGVSFTVYAGRVAAITAGDADALQEPEGCGG